MTAETLIAQLATSLGPVGILGWYCYYVTRVTLPALMAQFREEAEAIRADQKAERQQHHDEMQRMVTAMESMVAKCGRGGSEV